MVTVLRAFHDGRDSGRIGRFKYLCKTATPDRDFAGANNITEANSIPPYRPGMPRMKERMFYMSRFDS